MLFQIPEPLAMSGEADFGKNINELVGTQERYGKFSNRRLAGDEEKKLKGIGCPSCKWEVKNTKSGNGKVALAILQSDDKTGERLVLCAFEGDVRFVRQAVYGNTVLVLAGAGEDVIDNDTQVKLGRMSAITHNPGQFQYLFTKTFMVFLYYQPAGSTDPLWFA